MILALDIGGTKIAAARVDSSGSLSSEILRTPTPAREGPDRVVAEAVALLQRLRMPQDRAVAVSTAGVVDTTTGTVMGATSSITGWAGTPLASSLSAAMDLPAWVLGDGNAFGVGLAMRYQVEYLLAIVVGTGIGGGVILGGEPLLGAHHVGGHVGHVMSPQAQGMRCPCGRMGHLEAVASGHGILAWYHGHGGDPSVGSTAELVTRRTDDFARQALVTGGIALGGAAGALVNTLDPSMVVVSGSVAEAGDPWESSVRGAYSGTLMSAVAATPIEISSSGPEIALLGAAHFAMQRMGK